MRLWTYAGLTYRAQGRRSAHHTDEQKCVAIYIGLELPAKANNAAVVS